MMTPKIVTCPRCGERIDVEDRCPITSGMYRCMESAGHEGFHWTDVGRELGLLVWFGPYREVRCYGRLEPNRWCVKDVGHTGPHNDGRGTSWHEDDR